MIIASMFVTPDQTSTSTLVTLSCQRMPMMDRREYVKLAGVSSFLYKVNVTHPYGKLESTTAL